MFQRVLISDDLGSINKGVLSVLTSFGITHVKQVQYCDDAYLKIKKAFMEGTPFDLFITDLSFKADHRDQKYSSGEALIKVLKEEYPSLPIIVYSVEDRLQKARILIQEYNVEAYVCKGRKGLEQLKLAIESVQNKGKYLSPQIENALHPSATLDIDDYDIQLVNLLSQGMSQDEISQNLKNNNISPSSLSSIEKRLNRLRIHFKAKNAIHLVAIVKDFGLI